MSKVRLSGRQRKAQEGYCPISKRAMKNVVALYIFMMFAVYPLYYENKYFNMGDAKWHFFRNITIVGFAVIAVTFLWYQIHLIRVDKASAFWDIKKTSILDRFVMGYAIAAIISFALSPYKEVTLVGYDGWYMGFIAQMAFVIIYYFTSRFYRWDEILLIIYLVVSTVVFVLCLLNRFTIDPLEMYVDIEPYYIRLFISTLGQATWFSSYMIILFPMGLFAFWYYDKKIIHLLAGIYVFISGATMVAQNSDSGILGFGAAYTILFCCSFDDNRRMKNFLESLFLQFAGWKTLGILRTMFPENAVVITDSMEYMGKSVTTWVLIAIVAVIYIVYVRNMDRGNFDISQYKVIRTVYIGLLCGGIGLVFIYVCLNSTGMLDNTPFASSNNYLLFNDKWGSDRGLSWRAALGTFLKSDLKTKLFGAGPDGFYNSVYRFYSEPLNAKWGEGTVLTCAHNEWLNSLVNLGLAGFVFYTGLFICAIVRFLKNAVKTPELLVPAMCVLAYMAHNFFCYQQIICTPLIFIMIGAGEEMCRNGRLEIWVPDGD